MLDSQEHARHVDRHHVLEYVGGVLVDGRDSAFDSGVVEQHIDAAKARRCLIDVALHVAGNGDIRSDCDRLGSRRGRQIECLVERALFQVDRDDPRALACEQLDRCPSDASRGTGHDHGLSDETLCH